MTISGTFDSIGITLNNPSIVQSIATALRTNTAYGPVSSNGYSWAVGNCAVRGYYSELSANGGICTCRSGYVVRPSIGNSDWGGVNSATCSGSSQTMIVTFQ